MSFGINAKASVVSRYMCNEAGGNNGCDYTMPATTTSTELPLYYMGDNRPFFANAGQGYINFSFIAWGYSGTYNLPIYSVEITSDLNASTGNQSLFACDIGTYTQYHDNQNNYVVYSVKCPVSIGNLGLHGIRINKYSGDETLVIKRGAIITFTSELDISNSINSSAQNIANQQMQNDNTNANNIIGEINRDMYGVQSRLDNYGTQAHQDAQNIINNFNNATQQQTQDILNDDQRPNEDKNAMDTSNIEDYEDIENETIGNLENEIPQYEPEFSWDDNALEWIWYVLNRAFNSNAKVFGLLISALGLGFSKFLLGR